MGCLQAKPSERLSKPPDNRIYNNLLREIVSNHIKMIKCWSLDILERDREFFIHDQLHALQETMINRVVDNHAVNEMTRRDLVKMYNETYEYVINMYPEFDHSKFVYFEYGIAE